MVNTIDNEFLECLNSYSLKQAVILGAKREKIGNTNKIKRIMLVLRKIRYLFKIIWFYAWKNNSCRS